MWEEIIWILDFLEYYTHHQHVNIGRECGDKNSCCRNASSGCKEEFISLFFCLFACLILSRSHVYQCRSIGVQTCSPWPRILVRQAWWNRPGCSQPEKKCAGCIRMYQDAPNLNKKMRRCWFCWSRFSPMRFCLSQLPRSEPPVVSQRSQMSNQSHPAPVIKHGLSRIIFRWTTPTMLQRKLAATMTHPQPPSGGGGGAFPKSFFESISFNWGKVISGDRTQRFD